MAPHTPEMVDRHVLVVVIWLPAALIAVTLFHYGVRAGGAPCILAAFGVIIAAFIGHVVVNVTTGTTFTNGELALGLVVYATALMAFGAATLGSAEFAARAFLPTSIGFLTVFAAFVFYMVVHSGVRHAFEAFDTVRSFRAGDQTRKRSERLVS